MGPAPAPAPKAQPAPARPADTGAGLILGAVFLYPFFINWLRGGPAQAWGWVKAKFINKPYHPKGK